MIARTNWQAINEATKEQAKPVLKSLFTLVTKEEKVNDLESKKNVSDSVTNSNVTENEMSKQINDPLI